MSSSINLTGLASGFDWQSFIDQMAEVERAPENRAQEEQTTLEEKNNAYDSIKTQLKVLQDKAETLKDASFFNSRTTSTSDDTVAKGTADDTAAVGAYTFSISQLATASSQVGTSDVGKTLASSNDVSGLVLSEAAFSTAITEGTFTVNGKQVTIATSDTLQGVFDKISTATNGTVTGSYDSATDKISFSSTSGEIVLGSSNDSSNFLEVSKLSNNGTSTVSSSKALGSVVASANLEDANFATAVTDGGSGKGEFKINGVSITYSASEDTVSDVLARINNSDAGVTASYDARNDRFVLTNETTGDVGVAMEDVTGNFLAASGLSSGTLSRGKNCIYTINGGEEMSSLSNTIESESSDLTGLSVTAMDKGDVTISVQSDSDSIKTAISSFVDAYNSMQSLIESATASTTDSKGKVTAGLLADEGDADEISTKLRSMVTSTLSSMSGTIKRLEGLGIDTNGNDNTLEIDSDTLDTALSDNLTEVKDLFTNSTDGLAVSMYNYLEKTAGDDGTLDDKKTSLNNQITDLDDQIADLEAMVQNKIAQWTEQFTAMETAQSNINQQLSYLEQAFSS
jgi:flagellar hook-associated protein 2